MHLNVGIIFYMPFAVRFPMILRHMDYVCVCVSLFLSIIDRHTPHPINPIYLKCSQPNKINICLLERFFSVNGLLGVLAFIFWIYKRVFVTGIFSLFFFLLYLISFFRIIVISVAGKPITVSDWANWTFSYGMYGISMLVIRFISEKKKILLRW